MSASVLIENVLQALYTGLVVGCIYGLMCVGLALIFSVMRVINFAQGPVLKDLAATGAKQFLFVAAPLPFVGGTGSPLVPMAIL